MISDHASSEIHIEIECNSNRGSSGNVGTPHQQQPDHPPLDEQKYCGAVIRCFRAFINLLRYEPKRGIESEYDPALRKEEVEAYRNLMSLLEANLVKPSFVEEVALHALIFVALVALLAAAGSIIQRGDLGASRWELFHLKIDRWVALVFVAVSGLPCIRLLTFVVSEPVVWMRKLDKYTFFFASKLKTNVDITLWFTLLLWVWYNWFPDEILKDTKGAKTLNIPSKEYKNTLIMATRQVTSMLMALAIGAFLWTLKDILYLKLKADLLINDVCSRIQRTILDLHAIQFISYKGEWSFFEQNDGKSKDKVAGGGATDQLDSSSDEEQKKSKDDFIKGVSFLKKENAPIWILERLIEKYMKYMRKKKTGYFLDLEDIHDEDMFMKVAKDMYSKIFISGSRGDDIVVKDLKNHGRYRKEFNHVFEQKMTEDQFYRWAVRALKNCLGFERTIRGYEPIFRKLNVLLSSFVVGLTVVIWLLLSRLVTTAELAILFAPFLSATFVFGDSLKTAFNGIVFVFGMHPFDLGDRVIINDGKIMKVREMMLLTTTFFVYDTGNEIIYPNSDLATKSIVNLDASKNMSDSVEFSVAIDTPEELLFDLQIRIKKTLDDELVFTSDTMVAKKQINDDQGKVTVLVHFKYLVAYHFETKTLATSKVLNLIMKLRKEMEKVKQMETNIENTQEQYEAETVNFKMDTKEKMKTIEKLEKTLMGILQKYESSKDCSKVIFTKINKDEKRIYIAVHIRYYKELLECEAEKQIIRDEIERAIKAGQGELLSMNR